MANGHSPEALNTICFHEGIHVAVILASTYRAMSLEDFEDALAGKAVESSSQDLSPTGTGRSRSFSPMGLVHAARAMGGMEKLAKSVAR